MIVNICTKKRTVDLKYFMCRYIIFVELKLIMKKRLVKTSLKNLHHAGHNGDVG